MQHYLKQEKVFLVIDNVLDEYSVDEARRYLEVDFHYESRILITSRSQEIVEELLHESNFCKPMPNLIEEEAIKIFLNKCSLGNKLYNLTDEVRQKVGSCIKQCMFSHDGSYSSTSIDGTLYHPMVLAALGSYFLEIERTNRHLNWANCLKVVDNFKVSRHFSDIFQNLKLRFDTFDEITKLLFLDIALYGEVYMTASTVNGVPDYNEWVTWLAGVHGEPREVIREQVLVFDLGYNVYVTCDGCLDLEINLSSGQ